jgi:ferric-dicitrate binding protein FerR (iron transport regulator)
VTPERLQEFLNAFVDDQLDAAGQRELAKALETDEEARRAFVRATNQHQALRDLLGRPAGKQPTKRRPWLALALAAAAALLLALSMDVLRPKPVATPPSDVVIEKPAPPRPPTPPAPSPEPLPVPPRPDPKPVLAPLPPTPPPPAPREPEKAPDPKPAAPEPKPPEPPPVKPPAPPLPAPKETAIAIATLESVRGEVLAFVAGERKPVAAGQAFASGQGLSTGAGNAAAVLVFPDATRLELRPGTVLAEISAAAGKKIVLDHGSVYADIARQPAGQPLVIATKHAEATILGTKLTLSCADATKLELKEGKVRFTRSEDKRSVDVAAGQYSVAGKGLDLSPKKITRGSMMAGALWGEDFEEPDEIDKDWTLTRTGLLVTTRGQLTFDLTPSGNASLGTRATFSAPFRVSVDVEFTQRLKGSLLSLRLQDWKQDKQFIHVDLDEDRYYLMMSEQTVTADVSRKNPRRERWTLEVGGDGAVAFLVDGKPVVKGRRTVPNEEFHVSLLAKSAKDVAPGAHVRFDNLVIEKLK